MVVCFAVVVFVAVVVVVVAVVVASSVSLLTSEIVFVFSFLRIGLFG